MSIEAGELLSSEINLVADSGFTSTEQKLEQNTYGRRLLVECSHTY